MLLSLRYFFLIFYLFFTTQNADVVDAFDNFDAAKDVPRLVETLRVIVSK